MPMPRAEIERMIHEALPDAKIEVRRASPTTTTITRRWRGGEPVVRGAFEGQAASVGLRGAERPHGRRTARAGADDIGGVS